LVAVGGPIPDPGPRLKARNGGSGFHEVVNWIFTAADVVSNDVEAQALHGIEDPADVFAAHRLREAAHPVTPPGQGRGPTLESLILNRGIDERAIIPVRSGCRSAKEEHSKGHESPST